MRTFSFALAGVLLALGLPVHAQTVEQDGAADEYSVATERAQKTFLQYYRSIEAAAECRQVKFSPDDLLAMDRAIAQQMVADSPNVSLGAARLLNLRREAEDKAESEISRQGCDGPAVKKYLAFYDERLTNVHPAPEPPLPGTDKPASAQPSAEAVPPAPPAPDTSVGQPSDAAPASQPESLVPAAKP